jgi:hypothetical protein
VGRETRHLNFVCGRTWPAVLGVCLLAAAAGCKRKEAQTVVDKVAARLLRGNSFQIGADVVRLRHLKYYGELIEEFHAKTGSYPLQGRHDFPVYVHVGHEGQKPAPNDAPPYQHEVVAMPDFVAALEQGLGRAIDEHYDPQLAAFEKPNFYIYAMVGEAYYFAVHISQPLSFAKEIGPDYFKIEISNRPSNGTFAFAELIRRPDFIAALQTPIAKPGFFEEREQRFLHDSKRNR